ncbi:hypothetical protein, partial [Pseudomonas sp. 71_D]
IERRRTPLSLSRPLDGFSSHLHIIRRITMQELNQQEIAMVGGASLLTNLVGAIGNEVLLLGQSAYNFGANLTDSAGAILTHTVDGVASALTSTIGIIQGVLTGN